MLQSGRCARKPGEPPTLPNEQLQQQNERPEADEVEEQFHLRFSGAINKHTKSGCREQTQRGKRRQEFAKDQEQKRQEQNRKTDGEGLRPNEKFLFAHAPTVNQREQEWINWHPVPSLGDGVIAFVEVPCITEISALIAERAGRGVRAIARVRFESVKRENRKHANDKGAAAEKSDHSLDYVVCHPRRMRLTAIAARRSEISFEIPFIPCLPIQRVKWCA